MPSVARSEDGGAALSQSSNWAPRELQVRAEAQQGLDRAGGEAEDGTVNMESASCRKEDKGQIEASEGRKGGGKRDGFGF